MKLRNVTINGLEFEPCISPDNIQRRVTGLAHDLNCNEEETSPIFIVIMTGAFMFAADLLRQVDIDCDIRFLRAKSYSGTSSTGTIKIEHDFLVDIKGRNIIIIEDIVDSGFTVSEITKALNAQGAKSVKVCALLSKPASHQYDIIVDYLGFSIPNAFVLGYGLDHNNKGRNLSGLYQLV